MTFEDRHLPMRSTGINRRSGSSLTDTRGVGEGQLPTGGHRKQPGCGEDDARRGHQAALNTCNPAAPDAVPRTATRMLMPITKPTWTYTLRRRYRSRSARVVGLAVPEEVTVGMARAKPMHTSSHPGKKSAT